MLPLILATFIIAQTEPPAHWPSYVTVNGRTYEKSEETLPFVHQMHRRFWERPGCGGPSNAVPASERIEGVPTLSVGRWNNGPCCWAYTYRLTNDEIARLNLPSLCAEMELARCWDDTHYLSRLTASLATRFVDPSQARDHTDDILAVRMYPATADRIERYAAGTPVLGMDTLEVMLTLRAGLSMSMGESEDPTGKRSTSRYGAATVRAGQPSAVMAAELEAWGVLPLLDRHTITMQEVVTLNYLRKPGSPATELTWWRTENGGMDARTAGMAQWRAAVLAEAPTLFTKEPPPPPTPEQPTPDPTTKPTTDPTPNPIDTLPGDFSKPLPTTPHAPRPPDPNKPAPALPPTPQPPPDR